MFINYIILLYFFYWFAQRYNVLVTACVRNTKMGCLLLIYFAFLWILLYYRHITCNYTLALLTRNLFLYFSGNDLICDSLSIAMYFTVLQTQWSYICRKLKYVLTILLYFAVPGSVYSNVCTLYYKHITCNYILLMHFSIFSISLYYKHITCNYHAVFLEQQRNLLSPYLRMIDC